MDQLRAQLGTLVFRAALGTAVESPVRAGQMGVNLGWVMDHMDDHGANSAYYFRGSKTFRLSPAGEKNYGSMEQLRHGSGS